MTSEKWLDIIYVIKMKNKKGLSMTKALFAVFMLFVLIVIFSNMLKGNTNNVDKTLCGPGGDYDKDLSINSLDKCPCDEGEMLPCMTEKEECEEKIKVYCESGK